MAADYGEWFRFGNHAILGVFIADALLKMTAVVPRLRRYFGDGWNLFDFSVIIFSLIPATGQFAMIARLARLLRVRRLISAVPRLRLVVTTVVRSIPHMGHVIMLTGILFYIYAIVGYHLFHAHDPTHWGSLGASLLTLFSVVTLEGWTDIMDTALKLHALAWIYFVSFIVIGAFVIINLFIAIVISNLEESKKEYLGELEQPVSKEELLRELRQTQHALTRLHDRRERTPPADPSPIQGGG